VHHLFTGLTPQATEVYLSNTQPSSPQHTHCTVQVTHNKPSRRAVAAAKEKEKNRVSYALPSNSGQ